MNSAMAFVLGVIVGAAVAGQVWTFILIKMLKSQGGAMGSLPKVPKFFTMGQTAKKKPKVHDEVHAWAKENDRKLDN